ncbi:MAG TPA: IS66 family transposase [Burkholderiales bacterium]|nr:IS66 family transposase [Burkholderiales bacterium]
MMNDPPAPRTLEDALALLDLVWAEVVALRAENAQLRARVQELEARLGQNSTNSSRAPSSDPPETPPRPPAPPSGRRRGGQPGHPPHQRALVPREQVDQVVAHWPTHCRGCQAPLAAEAVGEPVRHQVTELPPVRAVVTEHQLHHVRCDACGTTTCAPLPADVPNGAFGPRLQATVAVLSGRYRLSRREVVGVGTDVLGAPLAVGSVDRLCQATAAALAAPVAELEQAVQQASSAHADETSWREAGQRCWLWVVVTAVATVFTLAPSRSSGVIQGLLGATFAGYRISDRWSAYTWVDPARRQVCWAHLQRDFQKLVDYGGPGRVIGRDALRLLGGLFGAWADLRADPTQRERFVRRARQYQWRLRRVLERGQQCGCDKTANCCTALLKLWPALWTFVTVPGIEPTNNAAEQAIRPAVLWRKGSFGTQSAAGNRFVERLLSVAATCKQHDRSLLTYLTAVCTAAQAGQPIPSLLPPPPAALPSAPLAQAA